MEHNVVFLKRKQGSEGIELRTEKETLILESPNVGDWFFKA